MLIFELTILFLGLALTTPILYLTMYRPYLLLGSNWLNSFKSYHVATLVIIFCLFVLSDSNIKYFGLQEAIENASGGLFLEILQILIAICVGPILFGAFMLLGVGPFILYFILGTIFPSIAEMFLFQSFADIYATATPIVWILALSLGQWMLFQLTEEPQVEPPEA